MSETDLELLARYSRQNAEDAFAEMVRRHLDLVYSAALRQVHSPQLAEEVAQSAFLKLARHARDLPPETIVTAWLYQVTRREAIDVVRREARRQLREQIASEMNAMNATDDDWAHLAPLLDEAMHALDETDRAAVLLRYFENKSLREVGAVFGLSDDAAQKRVSRAVERLREFLTRRGIAVGASGLVLIISANAVQAAPLGLAVTISAAAAAGATLATNAIATKAFTMTTLQKSLIVGAIVTGVSILCVIQHQTQIRLREENQSLRWQVEQLDQERAENGRLSNLLAQTKSAELLSKDQFSELLRLRGEVGVLRQQTQELKRTATDTVSARTLATNEMLYREMIDAFPVAAEVVEGHPTRVLWEDRKSALLQAGYIETRVIPMSRPVAGKDAARIFFDRAYARFGGLEWSVRGFNAQTPPIATVTARKTDFGPSGSVEQFIRNYEAENARP